jgi:hypothetical protein
VLLGVRCATYMMLADGIRVAMTMAFRDDNKVHSIFVCADADLIYRRDIVGPA